jgi:hypothetical protein
VRASFCVSNVGIIVSSSGAALGVVAGAGVGISVCARVATAGVTTDNAIHQTTFLVNIILSESEESLIIFRSNYTINRDASLRST